MRHHVAAEGPTPRFGDRAPVLAFRDPDGLMLELVGLDEPGGARRLGRRAGAGGARHPPHPRGLPLVESYDAPPAARPRASAPPRGRRAPPLHGPGRGRGGARCAPGFWPGAMGAGAVHHVAFRVPDLAAEEAARGVLAREAGLDVTPVLHRQYFRSVYFREPAACCSRSPPTRPASPPTSRPKRLGEQLKLPAWLESRREAIERRLPELHAAVRPAVMAGATKRSRTFSGPAPTRPADGAARAAPPAATSSTCSARRRRRARRARAVAARGGARGRGEPLFRRFAEGVFDLDDLRRRADDLAAWVEAARETYREAFPAERSWPSATPTARGSGGGPARGRRPGLRGRRRAAPRPAHARSRSGARSARPVGAAPSPAPRTTLFPRPQAARLAVALRLGGAVVRHEAHPGRRRNRLGPDTGRRCVASSPISPPAETAPEQGA